MCGIFFTLNPPDCIHGEYGNILERIRRRGPDSFVIQPLKIGTAVVGVLWLQGEKICVQPPINEAGGCLCWNGDVYGGLEIIPGLSDTLALSQALEQSNPLDVMGKIRGPFAFVYFQDDYVWFGRDYFGRHSLLFLPSNEGLTLSSVGDSRSWIQVPANGLYRYSISHESLTLFPWSDAIHCETSIFNIPMEVSPSTLTSPIIKPSRVEELSSIPLIKDTLDVNVCQDHLILEQYIQKYEDLIQSLENNLIDSVSLRAMHKPPFCSHCLPLLQSCTHSKIGLLFSGGLDSSYLAYILHQVLPRDESIVLYNVAFGDNVEKAPDRITGRKALNELKTVCADRIFHFVAIDVSKEELMSTRTKEKLDELLLPSATVLDDSIGCALWFAAKGSDEHKPRVLIIGSGADEQLGGYSRHRAVFNRDGWNGLFDEMRMEVERISERNLGRDNRIISDHGVASRIPFLDENVVNFLNQVPLNLKMDLNCKRGLGEKLLLRAAAYKVGLKAIASEPKRAIQFGSRIAKIENKKEKGSDLAIRNSTN